MACCSHEVVNRCGIYNIFLEVQLEEFSGMLIDR